MSVGVMTSRTELAAPSYRSG